MTICGPSFGIRQPFLAASPATPNEAPREGLPVTTGDQANGLAWEALPVTIFGYPERNRDVTFLGSMCWIFTFIYTPVIEVLWAVANNWSEAPSILLISRAVGLGVTAFSYTIDTQAHYGLAFGKKLGSKKVVPRLMNMYSAAVNTLLSMIVVLLLSRALVLFSKPKADGKSESAIKWLALPYIIFSSFGAFVSLRILWPRDEGWSAASLKVLCCGDGSLVNTLKDICRGLFMGVFAGLFVALPALLMLQNAVLEKWGEDHGIPRVMASTLMGSWI